MKEFNGLTIKDFERREASGFAFYLGHDFDEYEICLEPCMNGYCVAIYKGGEIVSEEPKRCTNLKSPRGTVMITEFPIHLKQFSSFVNRAQSRALKYANELKVKYMVQ